VPLLPSSLPNARVEDLGESELLMGTCGSERSYDRNVVSRRIRRNIPRGLWGSTLTCTRILYTIVVHHFLRDESPLPMRQSPKERSTIQQFHVAIQNAQRNVDPEWIGHLLSCSVLFCPVLSCSVLFCRVKHRREYR